MDICGRGWTSAESRLKESNVDGPSRTVMDAGPAVFKTVCGLCESKGPSIARITLARHLINDRRGQCFR
jgi:hypothetical protein